MSKPPPVEELEFLKLVQNHGELTRKLQTIGTPAPDVLEYAKHVCECWFKLAEDHLAEARGALTAKCTRAVFSRSYYAAYNASKAVRYIVSGWVSLKGDDHGRAAAELPDDLPNLAQRSQDVTILYEHRLRADYENWSNTSTSNSLSPVEATVIASDFIDEIRGYINTKFGMAL